MIPKTRVVEHCPKCGGAKRVEFGALAVIQACGCAPPAPAPAKRRREPPVFTATEFYRFALLSLVVGAGMGLIAGLLLMSYWLDTTY